MRLSRLGRLLKIVVTNLKGGVGKTTTTLYLAAVAASRGHTPVVVVDADRQASAAEWLEERPIDGVEVIEAPSERTLARAMNAEGGTVVVDLPPGDERLVQSAIAAADAVVIPTRAGGIEFARVAYTLGMIPSRTPRGIVVTAARLGTNDLQETIDWWKAENVPVWGVVPERVGIAAGPRPGCIATGSTSTARSCAASCAPADPAFVRSTAPWHSLGPDSVGRIVGKGEEGTLCCVNQGGKDENSAWHNRCWCRFWRCLRPPLHFLSVVLRRRRSWPSVPGAR